MVTEKENVKIVFYAHLCQTWIDLRHTKTKMIIGPFYTYRRILFTSGIASFCDSFLSFIIWEGCMEVHLHVVYLNKRTYILTY